MEGSRCAASGAFCESAPVVCRLDHWDTWTSFDWDNNCIESAFDFLSLAAAQILHCLLVELQLADFHLSSALSALLLVTISGTSYSSAIGCERIHRIYGSVNTFGWFVSTLCTQIHMCTLAGNERRAMRGRQ